MMFDEAPQPICSTRRLSIRLMTPADAAFMLRLLNDLGFLLNIGDRGVRTLQAAGRYIETGPMASYRSNGFGLYVLESRQSGLPLGICGLLRRDFHPDVEIGFALLAEYCGQGLGLEAAQAVMSHELPRLGLSRLTAIAAPDNGGSIRLLEKLGLRFERPIRFPGGEEDSWLFAMTLPAPPA